MSSTKLKRLPTWTTLSVRKEFEARTENIPVFYEETIKRNNKEPIYVELRIDGPYCKTLGSRNEIEARIEVNALISAEYNEQDTQSLNKLAGIIIQALSEDFCIYKLGAEPCDTREFFETYQLIVDDEVQLSNFGQIDQTNKIYQATVEAHYKVRFTNGTI